MPTVTTMEDTGIIALIDDLEPYSGSSWKFSFICKNNWKYDEEFRLLK